MLTLFVNHLSTIALQWWGVGLILLIATNRLNDEKRWWQQKFLLQRNSNAMDIPMAHLIPDCLRVDYKRGKRRVIRQRLKKFKNVPTTLLINAHSLRGKGMKCQRICTSNMNTGWPVCWRLLRLGWMTRVPNREVEPAGFTPVRADRDRTVTGKISRRSVCLSGTSGVN